MIEVMVYLLIALPNNASISGPVATFKTKEACEAVRVEMGYTRISAKCIQANIFVPR